MKGRSLYVRKLYFSWKTNQLLPFKIKSVAGSPRRKNSREHIVRIENGTKIPSISVLVKIANTLSVSADELLLDCLEHSSSSANSEFHRLLLDCNETEQTVIIRMAKELKATLVSLGV